MLRDESFPDLSSQLIPHRDVLQIGVRRAESSRSCHRLIERGMNFTRVGMNQCWQCVNIGTQQFFQSAIGEELVDDRMFAAQFLQNILTRTVIAALGLLGLLIQLQPLKQNLAHLFAGVDIESRSSQLINLLLDLVHLCRQYLRRLFQGLRVYGYTGHLHICQHIDQGHLDLLEKWQQSLLLQFGRKVMFQLQGDVGILSGIFGDFL